MYMKMIVIILLLLVVGCGAKFNNQFATPIVGGNESVSLSVKKFTYKKGDFRVWATIQNRTDSTLHTSYGSFIFIVNGQEYPGALKIPFAKTAHNFSIPPQGIKETPGPIHAKSIPVAADATLRLSNITFEGQGGTPMTVSVTFPMSGGTSSGAEPSDE
jgi:hypothetical protein